MLNYNNSILITGSDGQLGYDLCNFLRDYGYKNVVGIDKSDIDLLNYKKIYHFIRKNKPDIVIHCGAWTAVDKAEDNKRLVYKINARSTKYISKACKKNNAKLIYISTDYVFDGTSDRPYLPNDKKNPLSVYGASKSKGEDFVLKYVKKHFILRITWAFGIHGSNFIKTMVSLSDSNKENIRVVDDQIGSPTYTKDLSELICKMLHSEKYGIYHCVNNGYCSCADLAEYIFKTINSKTKVIRVSTKEYSTPAMAIRPLNSRLDTTCVVDNGFSPMPLWEDAVKRFLINDLKR